MGYEKAAKIAKQALTRAPRSARPCFAIGYVERGDLTEEQLDDALDVARMTGRSHLGVSGRRSSGGRRTVDGHERDVVTKSGH